MKDKINNFLYNKVGFSFNSRDIVLGITIGFLMALLLLEGVVLALAVLALITYFIASIFIIVWFTFRLPPFVRNRKR